MTDKTDLTHRARELAKRLHSMAHEAGPSTQQDLWHTYSEYVRAADECSQILRQLADELDWIIKWALERCYCECGRGFLERGMHGPDCLIEELGLDDLVEHEEFQRKRNGVKP